MNTHVLTKPRVEENRRSGVGFLNGLAKSLVLSKLKNLGHGRLELVDRSEGASDVNVFGTPERELNARVTARRPGFFTRMLLSGSIGAGEGYAAGDYDCDDPTALVRLFVRNRAALSALDGGWGAALSPLARLAHVLRRNTIDGSRANIHAHYDMGNDFFALFLDDTWMYSAGIFPRPDSTLFEASTEKNDRICRKLDLKPSDHLLEIGTGWGSFALHAAKNYGCRVTTATISQEQYDFARRRAAEAGLAGRVEVLLRDYRLLNGQYDKLVSIEMIEAVGLEFLGTYFAKCSGLLKPSGSMLLQSIIIQDRFFEAAKRSVDFIQKHIFPGAGIPSVGSIAQAVAQRTDMRLFHQEDISSHYARTLRIWSQNLERNQEKITALGYPPHLHRLWQFYFAYCEGGFLEQSIGTVQMLFTKPEARREPLLGAL